MADPKDGSAGSPIPPAEPTQAHEADNADPGEVDQVKADQQKTKSGKYGSSKLKPYQPPATEEEKEARPSWIEIELLDEKKAPVAGEPYRICLPDGETVAEGTLDENGFARVDGIDSGQCKIVFPERDREAWHKG